MSDKPAAIALAAHERLGKEHIILGHGDYAQLDTSIPGWGEVNKDWHTVHRYLLAVAELERRS